MTTANSYPQIVSPAGLPCQQAGMFREPPAPSKDAEMGCVHPTWGPREIPPSSSLQRPSDVGGTHWTVGRISPSHLHHYKSLLCEIIPHCESTARWMVQMILHQENVTYGSSFACYHKSSPETHSTPSAVTSTG